LYRLYRLLEPGGAVARLMRITGSLTMIRAALIAVAAIAATVAATEVAAQSAAPVRTLSIALAGNWISVRGGEREVIDCKIGPRSDTANPQPGKPQFVIAADEQFVLLRVRAAEWSFSGGARDIAVTLVTADGAERQLAAGVRGQDMIDIAFGTDARSVAELAAQAYLEVRTEGTAVRLPLRGIAEVLPAYQACLAGIGAPIKPEVHAVAVR
jgi:hypothetical protein